MKIAGSNQDLAGLDGVVLGRLGHRQPAVGVQPLGEKTGKERRHVLDHKDWQWEPGGQGRQNSAQCVRPSR